MRAFLLAKKKTPRAPTSPRQTSRTSSRRDKQKSRDSTEISDVLFTSPCFSTRPLLIRAYATVSLKGQRGHVLILKTLMSCLLADNDDDDDVQHTYTPCARSGMHASFEKVRQENERGGGGRTPAAQEASRKYLGICCYERLREVRN